MSISLPTSNIAPMYVCVCNCVRDRDLHAIAASGVRCFEEVKQRTRVSTCCGRCEDFAREVFEQAIAPEATPQPA